MRVSFHAGSGRATVRGRRVEKRGKRRGKEREGGERRYEGRNCSRDRWKKKKKTLVRHSLSLVFRRPCKIERLAKKAGSFALLSSYPSYPLLKHIRPRAITRSLYERDDTQYGSIFYDNRGLEIVGLVEEEPLFERNFCSKLFLFVRRGNEIFIPKLWSISGEGTRCSVVRKNRLVVYARSIVGGGEGGGLISLPKFWQNRYLTRWRITRNDLYNEGI